MMNEKGCCRISASSRWRTQKPENNWRLIRLIAERALFSRSLSVDVKQNFRTRSGGTILMRSHCKRGGITSRRSAHSSSNANAGWRFDELDRLGVKAGEKMIVLSFL